MEKERFDRLLEIKKAHGDMPWDVSIEEAFEQWDPNATTFSKDVIEENGAITEDV